MLRRLLLLSVAVVALVATGAWGATANAPVVTVIDLGTLGGTNSDATGVNAQGQIVGLQLRRG